MKIKLNKIIVISLAVFLFFSYKAIQNTSTKINLNSIEKKEYSGRFELTEGFLLPFKDPSLLQKVRASNIFINRQQVTSQKIQSESSKIESQSSPLGKNEIKDEKTGMIFRLLGIIEKDGEYLAVFWKINELNLNQDEKKSVIIRKGSKLSENIRIYDIGEKWVILRIGGEKIELGIFLYLPEIIKK